MPGLPVKMRWRLWSSTGRPRSRRICCTRSRLLTRCTSRFTLSRPTRSSSSASSSSSGRGGGSSSSAGRAGGPGAVAGAPAVPAPVPAAGPGPWSPGRGPAAAAAASTACCTVDRKISTATSSVREGSRSRAATAWPIWRTVAREPLGPGTAVAGVGGGQHLEHGRGAFQLGAAARQHSGVAQVGGRGPAQVGGQAVAEGSDERPQLVVGVQPVGVDERAGQVVGLELDIGPQPPHVDPVDRRPERLDLGRQVVDERPHRPLEGAGGPLRPVRPAHRAAGPIGARHPGAGDPTSTMARACHAAVPAPRRPHGPPPPDRRVNRDAPVGVGTG